MNFIIFWKLLAGIAFFLWGMQSIEDALKFLSSRSFKLFLKKLSASRILSVLGGALASLVMQSSSLVNMMILAFVAAEVIQLENALALILGSNLGTTFNSWIFVFVGFKMEIEHVAYAIAGIFGFIVYLSPPGKKIYHWSKFLFGIGVIMIGLNLIKNGMGQITSTVDVSSFNEYPPFIFLLVGLVLTAILQASSATMIIVLSALNAHTIPLIAGMAIILGSEVGTTLKFLLVSIQGTPAKKRVAYGNVSFNVIMALLILLFLRPIDYLIREVIGIHDPLISVVFFQTLINIVAILLFTPFLHPISQFLNKVFHKGSSSQLRIREVNMKDPGKAMAALEEDIEFFIQCSLRFTKFSFELPPDQLTRKTWPKLFIKKNDMEQYEYLKVVHGEIHQYGHKLLSTEEQSAPVKERLEQLMTTNRNIMYAAKNIKDAFEDLHALRESSNEIKFAFYTRTSKQMSDFIRSIQSLLKEKESKEMFKEIKELYETLPETYNSIIHQLYKDDLESHLNVTEISTLLNFNREIYSALKSYMYSIKDYLLTEKEANYFDELPGFIR